MFWVHDSRDGLKVQNELKLHNRMIAVDMQKASVEATDKEMREFTEQDINPAMLWWVFVFVKLYVSLVSLSLREFSYLYRYGSSELDGTVMMSSEWGAATNKQANPKIADT
eukprot:CAMPEP_0204621678 /NCGR_PEP_ID=MMETSP0717-20131115/7315_1 /ASSEMBLY_ACC=CAM_ASM_000666 /TAXON_ID=230516 /ORGANISM="Chaetoceros curvisetus" /LENGTH=110 /DNA_ID=CAMNT_0051636137 /DNA_START=182 /DNA_END=514 /DNA_ORIENTATION=-